MKRFFVVFLSLMLAVTALSGCTKSQGGEDSGNNASGSKVQNPFDKSKDKDSSSKQESESSQDSSHQSSQEAHESSSKPEKEENSSGQTLTDNSSESSQEPSSESSKEESQQSSESSQESSESSTAPNEGEDQTGENSSEMTIPPLVDFVGKLSKAEVVVPGFRHITDMYGKDAIRIYYEYTNYYTEPVQVSYYLNVEAYQDGNHLEYTWCDNYDGIAESGNEWLWVYPGHTVRCFKEFNYDPSSDAPVMVEFYDGDYAYVYLPTHVDYEMDYLWTPFPAFMPEFTIGRKSGGYLTDGSYISCDNAYYLYPLDDSSLRAVEFNITFENNSDVAVSPGQLIYVTAYQDGVQLHELDHSAPFYYTDLLYKSVEPGESLTFQVYYLLRTDDPVEILLTEHYPNECIYGVMFSTFMYY